MTKPNTAALRKAVEQDFTDMVLTGQYGSSVSELISELRGGGVSDNDIIRMSTSQPAYRYNPERSNTTKSMLRLISYNMHDINWNHEVLTDSERRRVTADELANIHDLCIDEGVAENPLYSYNMSGRDSVKAWMGDNTVSSKLPYVAVDPLAQDIVLACREELILCCVDTTEAAIIVHPWAPDFTVTSGEILMTWQQVHRAFIHTEPRICDFEGTGVTNQDGSEVTCLVLTTPDNDGHEQSVCDACFVAVNGLSNPEPIGA